jgi:hypothetical protein
MRAFRRQANARASRQTLSSLPEQDIDRPAPPYMLAVVKQRHVSAARVFEGVRQDAQVEYRATPNGG